MVFNEIRSHAYALFRLCGSEMMWKYLENMITIYRCDKRKGVSREAAEKMYDDFKKTVSYT